MQQVVVLAGWGAILPAIPDASAADGVDSAAVEHFERRIRPLLHRHCYECHSGDAKVVQGGLRLDRRDLLLAGGDSGPAVTPGRPGESPLVASLMHAGDGLDMPPQGRLPQADIDLIVVWVARGAPMPAGGAADTARTQPDIESSRGFWSFLPLASPPVPRIDDPWVTSPIDAFVLAALRESNLAPAPEADRGTLL